MRKKSTDGYEYHLKQLKEAVALLEAGELPLENSLKTFEAAVSSYRACHQFLSDFEQKIEMLREVDGVVERSPFPAAKEEGDV